MQHRTATTLAGRGRFCFAARPGCEAPIFTAAQSGWPSTSLSSILAAVGTTCANTFKTMSDKKSAYDAVIDSPVGRLGIRAHDALTSIDFLTARTRLRAPRNPMARRVCRQLNAYFANPRVVFRFPVDTGGTVFQQRVWGAMKAIPAGQVRSYNQIATRLRSAPRPVGGACRANPVPIVVPCHRIVSASGLGGFMGATGGRALIIKKWLLNHEGRA